MELNESLKGFEGAVEAKRVYPPRIALDEKVDNFVSGVAVRVHRGDYKGKATLSYSIRVAETNARMFRTDKDKVDPNTGDAIREFVDMPEDRIVELRAGSDLIKKSPQPVEGQNVHITFTGKKKMGNAPRATAFYRLLLGKIEAPTVGTPLADAEI